MKRTPFCYFFIHTCFLLLSAYYHYFHTLQSSLRVMRHLSLSSQTFCSFVFLQITLTPLSILGGRIKSLHSSHMLSFFHQKLLHSRFTKTRRLQLDDLPLSDSKCHVVLHMSLLPLPKTSGNTSMWERRLTQLYS